MVALPKSKALSRAAANLVEERTSSMPANKITCIRCGTSAQANFYVSNDVHKKYFRKIPYCKTCIREIYKEYLNKYRNNVYMAIYYMCRKIDIPYIHSNLEGAMNNIKNQNSLIQGEDGIISAYMKGLAFAEQNGWGNCFDDSQGENQIEGLASYEELTKVRRNKKKPDGEIDLTKYDVIEYDTEDLQRKWGNFPNEDLSYLESEYLDWYDKLNGISDKSTEIMVKEVCLQCNEIRKDREVGVNVEKKLTTLQSLLKTSGLIEKQDEVMADRNVGMTIEDIEYKRPIKTVNKDLADVDKIRDIIYGFVGSLSRAEGKENLYTEKFDEIYGKYSIDIIDKLQQQRHEEETDSSDGSVINE